MQRSRTIARTFGAIGLTLTILVSQSTLAFADDVVNNVDASVDSTYEVLSLGVGGSPQVVDLYTVSRNGDGKNGCNLTGSTTLVVNVTSSNVSAATVSPSQITFTACEAVDANSSTAVTVAPVGTGSTNIEFSQASNNSGGTFELNTARFTVNVAPPPNTPPSISVAGVVGGSSYEFGAVPTAGCSVTDAEDGNSTFAATLSAIAGPLSAYGLGTQTATCSYTDGGGLTAMASATYTIVDTIAPTVNVSADVTAEATDATGAVVSFSASATDAVSGSLATTCTPASGSLFPIGTTTVGCSATDAAGNTGSASLDITVEDSTDPSVTISTTAIEGAKGWFNIDSSGTSGIIVTVTSSDAVGVAGLSCTDGSDPLIGVDSSGDTFTLTDGDHQVSCSASDAAGNVGSDSNRFKVDQTAPTMAASLSPAANAAGWNNSDVTVSYVCDDATSGIDPAYGCPTSDSLTANGLYVLHRSTADAAGNVITPSFTVKIDQNAPTITGSASPAPNAAGWNNSDVTVSFACTDDGPSGIKSCSEARTLTDEAADQHVSGTAVDNADNSASTDVGPINIDKTAPTITIASRTPANADGWNDGAVTVEFACEDGGSGVASLADPITITDDGISSATGTCVDAAGNSASITEFDIKIDTQAPTISGSRTPAANANGWNNSDVTVSFSCADNGPSGIKTDSVAGDTLVGEGAGQSVTNTGDCVDHAGNEAVPATVGNINIDRSAPTAIAFVGGGLSDGGVYYFGFVPSGPTSCTADGAISGLDSCTLDGGYSTAVGGHAINATAVDRAGNQSTTALSYTVSAWTLHGFYQPVDMSTPTTTVFNTIKGGSTVPLKFEIFAGSTELTDTANVTSLKYGEVACVATAAIDAIETTATGGTALRYDATAGQFIYNWKTPTGAGKCYSVVMRTADGSSLSAFFKVK